MSEFQVGDLVMAHNTRDTHPTRNIMEVAAVVVYDGDPIPGIMARGDTCYRLRRPGKGRGGTILWRAESLTLMQ